MKVRVKESVRFGYYGHRRQYPGDEFYLKSEKDFSSNWMEKVSAKEKAQEVAKDEEKPKSSRKPRAKKEAKPSEVSSDSEVI